MYNLIHTNAIKRYTMNNQIDLSFVMTKKITVIVPNLVISY